MELFKFQADEIDAAELQPNQASEVQRKYVKLSNLGKLKQEVMKWPSCFDVGILCKLLEIHEYLICINASI